MKTDGVFKYFGSFMTASILLVGCATHPSGAQVGSVHIDLLRLHDGAWLGPITVTGVLADGSDKQTDGSEMKGTITFLLTVCDGKGIFWAKRENGSFRAAARSENFSARSNLGSHLIYFENHDEDTQPAPGWVENQTMLVMEQGSKSLRAQWTRAVSNPLLPETASNRNFFYHGVGTLEPVASECPREIMKTVIND